MENSNNQETPELIIASHCFSGEDSYQVEKEVTQFKKEKMLVSMTWNTTPVMTGAQQIGRQLKANMIIVTTCLVRWETTEQDFKNFRQRLQLTGKAF